MNKINIKDLYLIFGNEKQKALRLLKEGKSKSEILKAAGCTIAVRLTKEKYSLLWDCPEVENLLCCAVSID